MRTALRVALVAEGVPLVCVPKPLLKALLHSGAATQTVTPEFVRRHFKRPSAHPSLKDRATGIAVLKYCLSDLGPDSYGHLVGLPLVRALIV